MELLDHIRKAEAEADVIRQSAQQEAREILKSTEEAILLHEREAAADIRNQYQQLLNKEKATTEQQLAAQAGDKQAALDALCQSARAGIPAAAQAVAERIMHHGNR